MNPPYQCPLPLHAIDYSFSRSSLHCEMQYVNYISPKKIPQSIGHINTMSMILMPSNVVGSWWILKEGFNTSQYTIFGHCMDKLRCFKVLIIGMSKTGPKPSCSNHVHFRRQSTMWVTFGGSGHNYMSLLYVLACCH